MLHGQLDPGWSPATLHASDCGVMFPALHHLRLGARPTLGARRAGGSAGEYLSRENEQRCRGLLEASTRRYRQEAVAAAVLVTLCSVGGYPALLYTLRSSTLTGQHKGDVSFPGGKRDSSDQDVIATALRETQEELGLHLGAESVWGVMRPLPTGVTPLHSPSSRGLTVAPVLAHLGPLECVRLSPNPQEVEDVFTIPLSHLLQAQNHGYTHFRHQGRYSHTLPIFLNSRYRVWGLTAIITDLTLELLAPSVYRRRTRPPSPR
ncbi:mitochondrial coenzyme A diphosphatase NUDT8 isoform X2 [Caretta caretta]|uniref:mitochondrial coenzyme A diphosphatase NUDT8 isoform X2 n=1 Tax=Caretta caretta TaxID=8467 RepID=UPI00209553AE|nr:mitochondrial coenzyme A diphosphatase NUDT8 isoform X2 [Caretta caretta]XP_048710811.1 mitochondrial coenzyme A diphosphatase NUDT8 isoform X2 [Caretta caretta]